jgi:hypothetical protein
VLVFVVNEADIVCTIAMVGGESTILCSYVGDVLIFGIGLNLIKEDFLSNNFVPAPCSRHTKHSCSS